MKKVLLFIMLFFIMPVFVSAKQYNDIYKIDIDVYIDKDGTANITEIWNVNGVDGTEWYKVINNLGNMEFDNFYVYRDGRRLKYVDNWNIDASLEDKRNSYGIIETEDGIELCFGKYDYSTHTFKLKYNLSNFVFNTDDAQVVYFNFIDKLSSVDFDNFSVSISSYYKFPDTLDVWGYGYNGYAYVKDGKISMSNEKDMDGNYVVLLVKFPLNTFNTNNSYSQFQSFDDVYTIAKRRPIDYSFLLVLLFIVLTVTCLILFIMIVEKKFKPTKYGFGYINDIKVNKFDVPIYKNIPCNGDLFYAETLMKLNDFSNSNENFLKAILFKWYKDGNILLEKHNNVYKMKIINPVKSNYKGEVEFLDLFKKLTKKGVLNFKDLDRFCIKNYDTFLNYFTIIDNNVKDKLRLDGNIYLCTQNETKSNEILSQKIYNDSVELYGLKKYIIDFFACIEHNSIDNKKFDEYMMYIYLFGYYDEIKDKLSNYNLTKYSIEILDCIEQVAKNAMSLVMKGKNELYVDFNR